jgi:hypothetical protein
MKKLINGFMKGVDKTGTIKDKDYEKERLEKEFNEKLK